MAKKSNQTAVKIDNDLIKLLDEYGEIIGNPNRAGLLRAILWDFFNDLDFNNEFIELEEPLYFVNHHDFMYDDKMYTFKSTDRLDDMDSFSTVYQLNKIPINLDEYDIDNGCYCYKKDITQHRGVYIYIEYDKEPYLPYAIHPLIIGYDVVKEEAWIKPFDMGRLGLLVDTTIHKKIYDDCIDKYFNYDAFNNLEDNNLIDNKLEAMMESHEVIESYVTNKHIKHHLSTFNMYGEDSGFTMRSMLEHSKPVKKGWIDIYGYLYDLIYSEEDNAIAYYGRLTEDIMVTKPSNDKNKQ